MKWEKGLQKKRRFVCLKDSYMLREIPYKNSMCGFIDINTGYVLLFEEVDNLSQIMLAYTNFFFTNDKFTYIQMFNANLNIELKERVV